MLRNRTMQKSWSVLLVLMYAFVVLFSSKFHQHSHGYFSFDHDANAKNIHSFAEKSASNDCVACHFLTHKNSHLPQEFQYSFNAEPVYSEEFASYFITEFFSETSTFYLRGPPLV